MNLPAPAGSPTKIWGHRTPLLKPIGGLGFANRNGCDVQSSGKLRKGSPIGQVTAVGDNDIETNHESPEDGASTHVASGFVN